MRDELRHQLDAFLDECFDTVNQALGLSRSRLSSDAAKLVFFDATGAAGQLTVTEATGLNLGASGNKSIQDSSAEYAATGATAVTITTNSNGRTTITNDVVLTANFWARSSADTFQVLVHELLHYSSQQNDIDLARRLAGVNTNDGIAASKAFDRWLGGCFR